MNHFTISGKNMRRRGGFSLIELLVAAAIVAVLMAFVMPVLNTVRARTKELQCISNLRQIGVGVQLYGADFRVYVPFILPDDGSTPENESSEWSYLIKPYLDRTGGVHYSDSGPNERSPVIVCPSRSVVPPALQPTYSCHRHIMKVVGQPESPTPRLYGTIKRPSETLMVADSVQSMNCGGPGSWGCFAFAFQQPYTWTLNGNYANANAPVGTLWDTDLDGDNLRYRHAGRANVLFVDGHVASLKKGELKERNVMLNY